jgi:hypothetical protein
MYYIFANQKLECVQVFACILQIHIKERDTKTVCVRLRKLSSQFARDLTDKRHASLNEWNLTLYAKFQFSKTEIMKESKLFDMGINIMLFLVITGLCFLQITYTANLIAWFQKMVYFHLVKVWGTSLNQCAYKHTYHRGNGRKG